MRQQLGLVQAQVFVLEAAHPEHSNFCMRLVAWYGTGTGSALTGAAYRRTIADFSALRSLTSDTLILSQSELGNGGLSALHSAGAPTAVAL